MDNNYREQMIGEMDSQANDNRFHQQSKNKQDGYIKEETKKEQ